MQDLLERQIGGSLWDVCGMPVGVSDGILGFACNASHEKVGRESAHASNQLRGHGFCVVGAGTVLVWDGFQWVVQEVRGTQGCVR